MNGLGCHGWHELCSVLQKKLVRLRHRIAMQAFAAKGSFAPAVSIGRRNTLIFLERWSVYDEVPDADVLHEQTEVGDVGPMATRGVDEFDWATLQSRVVFDLSTFGAVWRDPAT